MDDETAKHIKTMNEVEGKRDNTEALERRIERLEGLMSDTIGLLRNQWTLPASMHEFLDQGE